MSGANTAPVDCTGQPGVYGTLGTPAAGNVPGGREGAASWIDESGNFWLFGGCGALGMGTVTISTTFGNLTPRRWNGPG
jgi:hypothetical protein